MITEDDFLKHAQRLIDPSNSPLEIDYRSAVSRAYYSLFHETKARLVKRGKFIPTKNAHGIVGRTLFSINKKAGRKFKSFRIKRNEADYDLMSPFFSRTNSETVIGDIEKLIRQVKSLLP